MVLDDEQPTSKDRPGPKDGGVVGGESIICSLRNMRATDDIVGLFSGLS